MQRKKLTSAFLLCSSLLSICCFNPTTNRIDTNKKERIVNGKDIIKNKASLSINVSKKEIKCGEGAALSVYFTAGSTEYVPYTELEFTVSDEVVAKVEGGFVYGVLPGTCVITTTYKGLESSITIEVISDNEGILLATSDGKVANQFIPDAINVDYDYSATKAQYIHGTYKEHPITNHNQYGKDATYQGFWKLNVPTPVKIKLKFKSESNISNSTFMIVDDGYNIVVADSRSGCYYLDRGTYYLSVDNTHVAIKSKAAYDLWINMERTTNEIKKFDLKQEFETSGLMVVDNTYLLKSIDSSESVTDSDGKPIEDMFKFTVKDHNGNNAIQEDVWCTNDNDYILRSYYYYGREQLKQLYYFLDYMYDHVDDYLNDVEQWINDYMFEAGKNTIFAVCKTISSGYQSVVKFGSGKYIGAAINLVLCFKGIADTITGIKDFNSSSNRAYNDCKEEFQHKIRFIRDNIGGITKESETEYHGYIRLDVKLRKIYQKNNPFKFVGYETYYDLSDASAYNNYHPNDSIVYNVLPCNNCIGNVTFIN